MKTTCAWWQYRDIHTGFPELVEQAIAFKGKRVLLLDCIVVVRVSEGVRVMGNGKGFLVVMGIFTPCMFPCVYSESARLLFSLNCLGFMDGIKNGKKNSIRSSKILLLLILS